MKAPLLQLPQALDERDAAVSAARAARGEAERLLTALRRQQREAQHQAACAAADLQRTRAEASRWRARCQHAPPEAQPPATWRKAASRPHRWVLVSLQEASMLACCTPQMIVPFKVFHFCMLCRLQLMLSAAPAPERGTCRYGTAV